MIELSVEVDNQSGIAGIISGITSQLPYATAVAINNTLNDAQDAIQQSLPFDFTLRRADFIERTIKIAPADRAKKDRPVGVIRVDPSRDFVAKFENGGEKTPTHAGSLAIPIMRETNKMQIIGRNDPLGVKQLLAAIDAGHGKTFKTSVRKGMLRVTTMQARVFLIKNAKGTFILQSMGDGHNRILYSFQHSVPIAPQLHFDDTAMRVAVERWDYNFEQALEHALETAN